MRKVEITLTFDVEEKDLQHQYVSEFISNARSGKMRKEVEDSAIMGNTPIKNINVECKIN